MVRFDALSYWRDRHQRYGPDLRRVGHRRLSPTANALMYRKVLEQLDQVIPRLGLAQPSLRVLDAGAGIGLFTEYYCSRGADIWATDISLDALEQIRHRSIPARLLCCRVKELSCLPSQSFDLVHCFDVLYHIIDDNEWEDSLRQLGRLTNRYLLLHGRFSAGLCPWRGKHVRMRSLEKHGSVLQGCGLRLRSIHPTHYLFVRSALVPLVNLMPSLFYSVDAFLAKQQLLRRLAATQICVFERVSPVG